MEDLEPASPAESLRAVRSDLALDHFRRSLSGGSDDGDATPTTTVARSIDDFWSYSRSGSAASNLCALLLYYNGAPGALAGSLSALASALLLPAHWHDQAVAAAAVLFGACACVAVAVLRPSQRQVFLDSACIAQDSEAEKRIGILSLGFYVKSSKNMLVLWDSSYLTRQWCIYELATFFRLRGDNGQGPSLKMLSAPLSMMTCIAFVGAAATCVLRGVAEGVAQSYPSSVQPWGDLVGPATYLSGAALLAVACRPYLAEVAKQRHDLEAFSASHAECFCCSCGHKHPETQEPLDCDKLLIQRVIAQWFGSARAFNETVRSELQQLQSHASAKALLQLAGAAAMPVVWHRLALCLR